VLLGANPNPKNTKFPFGPTKKSAEDNLDRTRKSDVPLAIRPYLISCGPFDPNDGGDESLFGLNEIRNGKIHKTLAEVAAARGAMGFSDANWTNGSITLSTIDIWDSEKRELTYMRAKVIGHADMQVHITVSVAFANGSPFAGRQAAHTLREVAKVFDRVVLGIEAETTRLIRNNIFHNPM
jgi:hypothetical protein